MTEYPDYVYRSDERRLNYPLPREDADIERPLSVDLNCTWLGDVPGPRKIVYRTVQVDRDDNVVLFMRLDESTQCIVQIGDAPARLHDLPANKPHTVFGIDIADDLDFIGRLEDAEAEFAAAYDEY